MGRLIRYEKCLALLRNKTLLNLARKLSSALNRKFSVFDSAFNGAIYKKFERLKLQRHIRRNFECFKLFGEFLAKLLSDLCRSISSSFNFI